MIDHKKAQEEVIMLIKVFKVFSRIGLAVAILWTMFAVSIGIMMVTTGPSKYQINPQAPLWLGLPLTAVTVILLFITMGIGLYFYHKIIKSYL